MMNDMRPAEGVVVIVLFSVLWVIAAIWIALSVLPAGWEGHMPMPYLIALIPFLWIPLVVLAVWAAFLHEWGVVSAMLVLALAASSRRLQYHGSGFNMTPSSARTTRNVMPPSSANMRETSRETTSDGRETNRETSTVGMFDTFPPNHTKESPRLDYDQPFTVMTLNCRFGRADAAHIMREVRERNVTVLALQELTGELVAALDEEGLATLLPYRQLGEERDTDNGGFNGIWTSYAPVDSTANAVDIPAADVPSVTIALSRGEADSAAATCGTTNEATYEMTDKTTDETTGETTSDDVPNRRYIMFASAHPKSPMRGCDQWSAGIRGLGALGVSPATDGETHVQSLPSVPPQIEQTPEESLTPDNAQDTQCVQEGFAITKTVQAVPSYAVVMGDLNSGTDHPSFRALLKAGFTDASLAYAHGPNLTFPSWLSWPRIELDHVLFTHGITVSHVESFAITTTDHLAVTATLIAR